MSIEAIAAGLTAFCVFAATVAFAVCCLINLQRVIDAAKRRVKNADKNVLVLFAVALTIYAGAKHRLVDAGADAAISLVSVGVEYDSTNEVTSVEVRFLGDGVTTSTPVSVRNANTENWRELTKIGADITADFTTNLLSFAVSGDATTNRFWWVGVDTPAVIIETKGIEIEHFAASSSSVQIVWSCDDPNATEFTIQRRRKGTQAWETVGVTTSFAYIYIGFTVGETWEWRVSSTYQEDNQ